MKEFVVFVIDDQLPVIQGLVAHGVYEGAIEGSNLQDLLLYGRWQELTGIKWCLERLCETPYFQERRLQVLGFTDPDLIYRTLESGVQPDVVIFDWEYRHPDAMRSRASLLWLLESTRADIFIYSKVRDGIPPSLNNGTFSDYFGRLQLLAKDKASSFFSPEERIFQHIVDKLNTQTFVVYVDRHPVEFVRGKLLGSSGELIRLGRLVGVEEAKISAVTNRRVDDVWAVTLLETLMGEAVYDPSNGSLRDIGQQGQLVTAGSESIISYADVADKYSLLTLEVLLERGVVRVGSVGSAQE